MAARSLGEPPRPEVGRPEARVALVREAFERTAGAPFSGGNEIDLLIDAQENYPAWRQAIEAAERSVHLEMYILHDDEAGRALGELLARKAREGVRVRVLYDWWGAIGSTIRGLFRRLRARGVEVRSCNPPRLSNALSWASRDHRKLLVVDGRVGFVSGLCVGQDWLGFPERGIPPWRDTGVVIRGPAVLELERAFADMWPLAIDPANGDSGATPRSLAGGRSVGVVASSPEMTRLLRLDLLWAAIARERLWLSDAYFMPISAYLGALQSAALDGVDVRLLVPSASDVRLIAAFSRTQYRPLLEAGVRVFEWKGPMMHAKTAVVDGLWSRVGSSNLNIASWSGNWELDVCVEDAEFADGMESVYLRDLTNATEIVLDPRHRVQPAIREPKSRRRRRAAGSAGRAAAAALRLGKSFGAALAERGVAQGEARAFAGFGLALLLLALMTALWPKILSYTVSAIAAYAGIALVLRAARIWRRRRRGTSRDDAAAP
jgi:cardiolipin synthase